LIAAADYQTGVSSGYRLSMKNKGKVYLVGAGPGDPGLITVKGMSCIQLADVIIYDYLASPSLLELASSDAELIYVGKKGGDHTLSQNSISQLLVEKAAAGSTVTRLKGGDPFIFGRGGEEIEALVAGGIEFEVIPGVTSAIAAPAYAGIPLTHRKVTSSLTFVTGHEDPTKGETRIDWDELAKSPGTLVFLMGAKNLPVICDRLLQRGKPGGTPAAMIQWGTTTRQMTVTGTLATIADEADRAGISSPAIIVLGDVVRLRKTMKWFENKPLLGKNIIITRSRAQTSDMTRILTDWGAACLEFPTIDIIPPDRWDPLDRAISHIDEYHWIVFTSTNGVNCFFQRLSEQGKDSRALGSIGTASVGPATAERLRAFGVNSDIVPETYRAEAVSDAFRQTDLVGKKVLLPRAQAARPVLPDELKRLGARIDDIPAYRTAIADGNRNELVAYLKSSSVDLVTFTSSSTARNFKQLLPPEQFESLTEGVLFASIGPITTRTARSLGFDIRIEPGASTIPELCRTIADYYAGGSETD